MSKLDRYRKSIDLLTHRLSLIRAIYIVSVASNAPVDEVNREFRQAVGDILEGMAIPKLKLTHIDEDQVKSEAAWLRDRD